jgi:hypothetical protein
MNKYIIIINEIKMKMKFKPKIIQTIYLGDENDPCEHTYFNDEGNLQLQNCLYNLHISVKKL